VFENETISVTVLAGRGDREATLTFRVLAEREAL